MTAVLAAHGVGVVLGGAPVLDGVSLEVTPGRLTALVGPNGAGKSTLLSVLSGDLRPTTGQVTVDDRELHRWRAADLARERAVLPQEHLLSFPFRAAEVVAMGRAPWAGTPDDEHDDVVVAESMAETDTTHLAARAYPSLSGGEKARTSFARVLAQRVGVLLLDEPTAALDIAHQESVLGLVRRAVDAGAAAAVVLHDLSLAAAYADRVAVLEHGRLRAHGTPREVLEPALLSDVYGHPVDVVEHPSAGGLVVLPRRSPRVVA